MMPKYMILSGIFIIIFLIYTIEAWSNYRSKVIYQNCLSLSQRGFFFGGIKIVTKRMDAADSMRFIKNINIG